MNPTWRKSSFSPSNQNCVELADAGNDALMRDSKHPNQGHLTLSQQQLADLIAGAKAGALDHLA